MREMVNAKAQEAHTLIAHLQNVCTQFPAGHLADRTTDIQAIRTFAYEVRSNAFALVEHANELLRLANFHESAEPAEDLMARAFAERPGQEERERSHGNTERNAGF